MSILKLALSDLIQLRKPVTAAAIVALITQLIPGLHVNSVTLSAIFVGVGVVAAFVDAQLKAVDPHVFGTPEPTTTPVAPVVPPTPTVTKKAVITPVVDATPAATPVKGPKV